MAKRRYLMRGVYVACGIAACVVLAALVLSGLSYDGKCGGFFPGLAGPKPCSLAEYVLGNGVLFLLILVTSYWPALLLVFLVPPCIGYLYDRRAARDAT